jgi:CHAD domain-containing protein
VIVDAAPRVVNEADEEALHDLRVAIRRLRVLLKLARPLGSRFYIRAVREPFTAFHRATSELRDAEVLEITLAAVRVKDAAFERFKKNRKTRERRLRRDILDRLERGELDVARKQLHALLDLPMNPKHQRDLAPFAVEVVSEAQAIIDQKRDTPITDVVGLHDLRIAYKNLRYATEIFADVLPKDLAELAEPAKKLQTRLGDLHDVDVAIDTIRRARSLAPALRLRIVRSLRRIRAVHVRAYLQVLRPISAAL